MNETDWKTIIAAVGLIFSIIALIFSFFHFNFAKRVREADRFAVLYEEFNSHEFGFVMELVGEWINECTSPLKEHSRVLTQFDICQPYLMHLWSLKDKGINTKKDELERARRQIKAWFIKCLLFYEAKDLSLKQLKELITDDRSIIMWHTFYMTLAQTYFRKYPKEPEYVLEPGLCSDEKYFKRFADLNFKPPQELWKQYF